jgi:hypothetical protein
MYLLGGKYKQSKGSALLSRNVKCTASKSGLPSNAVWWDPDTLPSMPWIILAHHIITFLLLLFPLRHPEYANFTCWDGLTEINTFFLIARRQVPEHFRLLNGIYWVTFFPFRCDESVLLFCCPVFLDAHG